MSLTEPDGFTDPAPPPVGGDGVVALNKRYEIELRHHLPMLETALARCYGVRDKRDQRNDVVAYLCNSGRSPRSDILSSLRGVENAALMKVRDSGIVTWPEDGAQYPVILYDLPRGRPMVANLDEPIDPYTDEMLTRQVIGPIAGALKELRTLRVFHGQINPTNILVRTTPGQPVLLGDCATAPPGYCQPLIFETIERGMTNPAGRGVGTVADDLYALGVVILMLALGRNPVARLSDEQILQDKLERGSYAALVKDTRVSGLMMEPVRGLLLDDPTQRWTLEDLNLWLNGRRLSPKQPQPAKRAQRPLTFVDREYLTCRTLAHAMFRQPTQAMELVDTGDLDTWLRRSMEDDALATQVQEAVQSAGGGNGGTLADRKLARVLMVLDPPAPIRYRNCAVMPEGIGAAFADAMIEGGPLQELGELLVAQLPIFWINVQRSFNPELVSVMKSFETARRHIDKTTPGYGVERCLYQLNPGMPCRSTILGGYYVQDIDRMMYALDEIATHMNRPDQPADRHIIAFVLSRHGGISERSLSDQGPGRDECERMLGLLDIFFEMQRKSRAFPLPNLCAWLVDLMEPAIARYNSQSLRDRVRDELQKQAETGALKNIFMILGNRNLVSRDTKAFELAKREYRLAGKMAAHRQREADNREGFINGIGRQAAAVIASLLSALVLAGIVVGGVG